MKNNFIPSERQEQIKVIQYLELLKRKGKILFYFAIPNGGSRNPIEAKNLKLEGVRAGVSDICVITRDKVIFIEMKKRAKILKSGKKSTAGIKISDSQKEFIELVTQNPNIKARICYGFNEAIIFIEDEIKIKGNKND